MSSEDPGSASSGHRLPRASEPGPGVLSAPSPRLASRRPVHQLLLFGLLVVVLSGLVLTLLHHRAQGQRTEAAKARQQLDLAQRDLSIGSLQQALAIAPDSPWTREQGHSLVEQALAGMDQVIDGASGTASADAEHLRIALRGLRAQWDRPQVDGVGDQLSRRLVPEVIEAARDLEKSLAAQEQELADRLDRGFHLALVTCALLIGGIAVSVMVAEQSYAAAARVPEQFHERLRAAAAQHSAQLEHLVHKRTAALEQAISERLQSDHFARAVVDHIPDGLGYWSSDQRCLFANQAYCEHLGRPAQSLVGSSASTVFGAALWAQIEPWSRTVLGGKPQQFERETLRPDGSLVSQRVQYLPDRRGAEVVGVFVLVSDISDLKRTQLELATLNRQLAAARDAAQASSRAKSAFLANISHEIRTPMNAIVGLSHLLSRGELPAAQRNRAQRLDEASRHLLTIVSDVLELSRIEAGRVDIAHVDFPLSDVLQTVAALIADAAAAKGLQVQVDSGDVPAWLRGDPARLRQALLNYASNAVKFSTHGSIRLSVTLVEVRGDDLQVRFEVRDQGSGIDAQDLSRLFSAFEQVDTSTTRRHGGTGLGLAITQRLARAMGGDAGADSQAGIGSRFWFTVTLQLGSPGTDGDMDPPFDASEMQLRERHAGARILVAEDHPINQEIAQTLLESADLVVDVAADGVEAVQQVAAHRYQLVLMDVQMPRLDGLAATREIRRHHDSRQLPIIAMTANAFGQDRDNCLAAGMNDFVAKPVSAARLYEVVLRWLSGGPPGH